MDSAANSPPPISIGATQPVAIARFASLTLASLVLDRVFAFAFTVVMSTAFGTSKGLDMYLVALALPAVIGILVGDLIYSQLLPELMPQGGGRPADPRWKVVIWTVGALCIVNIVYVVTWRAGVALLQSGPEGGKLLMLGTTLSPLILLSGIAALGGTILVAEQAYFAATLRIPIASLVTLLSFFVWRHVSADVEGLVASVLTGAVAAALLTSFVAVRILGSPSRPTAADARAIARRLGRGSLAQLVAGVLGQASVPIERLVGAGVGAGVVSSLNYGRVVVSPPLLLGQSIATASYPRFVDLRARRDPGRYRELGRTNGMVLFLLLPLSVLLASLASPLVRLLYQRGTFGDTASTMTSISAAILAIGLVPIAVSAVVTRFLYAEQRSARVAVASGLTLVGYSVLAISLGYSMNYVGLAAASTASNVLFLCILSFGLRDGAYRGWEHLAVPSLLRSGAAALLMCVVTIGTESLLAAPGGYLAAVGAAIAGLAVYWGVAVLLQSPELNRTLTLLRTTRFRLGSGS